MLVFANTSIRAKIRANTSYCHDRIKSFEILYCHDYLQIFEPRPMARAPTSVLVDDGGAEQAYLLGGQRQTRPPKAL